MTFARESWPFVLPFVAIALALYLAGHPRWALAALVVAFAVLLFFRIPRRHFTGEAGAVLAPADGLVTLVDEVEDPAVGPGRYQRVVTFLSVFDVHVQSVPAGGKVIASALSRGRKVAAFRPDAGVVNEQHLTVIELPPPSEHPGAEHPGGGRIGVRQIAGLLARRVVCYLRTGETVTRGERLGLIKFGSRVDLLLPPGYRVVVKKGDRLKNGLSVVALPGLPDAANTLGPDTVRPVP